MAWFMAETDPRHRGDSRVIRWTMMVAMVGEIVLISMQAARGTTSHFNIATPFDTVVFNVMGGMIVANSLAAAAFIGTVRRDTAPSRAGYLWGMRLGLAIFVLGSFQGFFMVANMGHSVPGPTAGPGLPFVNWSTTVGDLRIAHFIGLHALQGLPLAGFLLDRTRTKGMVARTRAVSRLALIWLIAFVGMLALALAGRPLVSF